MLIFLNSWYAEYKVIFFRALYNEWKSYYWKLTDMVVPNSSRLEYYFIVP